MADEGASPKELVLEAARRNNTDLLHEVLDQVIATAGKAGTKAAADYVAQILNTARDGIGMGVLHLAALNGNYEVLDLLLDQEGLETDELDRMEKDTPLHKAVRFTNSLNQVDWAVGHQIVDILIDAGCDPRIRNGAKLRPLDLVDPRNKELRTLLQQAEYSIQAGNDVVQEDEGPAGSGSESD